jgi:threonine synthase
MNHVLGLECVVCGKEYSPDEVLYTCPDHTEGNLDVVYDYNELAKQFTKEKLAADPEHTIWRYSSLLPIEDCRLAPPLDIGCTPLYRVSRLEKKLGVRSLWVKDDGRNPTGSFKDRASVIAVTKAREIARDTIACASSGNAASSMAGVAASVGLSSVVFVPEAAPEAKIAQCLAYGAQVFKVRGTYDDAFDLSMKAIDEFKWYSRNSGHNPYLSEGKKTAALELCEQLSWNPPDRIFVAVGDGCIIGGLWKGFKDLRAIGFIENIPKLIGVQAEGARVLVDAWTKGTIEVEAVVPQTLADSIAVGNPRDRIKALTAVRESGGEFVAVADDQILEAMRQLAREAGIFAEPAGAAGLAGLSKMLADGRLDPDERIAAIVTGNGLKDIASAVRASASPILVEPNLRTVKAALVGMKHSYV